MTEALPSFYDHVTAFVDVLDVKRFYLVVRDLATGKEHSFAYDNILIGSTDSADRYQVVMPKWLADMEGIVDAR
jgi:hypothetical protein